MGTAAEFRALEVCVERVRQRLGTPGGPDGHINMARVGRHGDAEEFLLERLRVGEIVAYHWPLSPRVCTWRETRGLRSSVTISVARDTT